MGFVSPLLLGDAGVVLQLGRQNASAFRARCCISSAVSWDLSKACVWLVGTHCHVLPLCREGEHCRYPSQRAEVAFVAVLQAQVTWMVVTLCPAHAHRVAGTREIAGFCPRSKTSQCVAVEAQPLGAVLPAGEWKSSCHLPAHPNGGLNSALSNFSTCQRHLTHGKRPKWLWHPSQAGHGASTASMLEELLPGEARRSLGSSSVRGYS